MTGRCTREAVKVDRQGGTEDDCADGLEMDGEGCREGRESDRLRNRQAGIHVNRK